MHDHSHDRPNRRALLRSAMVANHVHSVWIDPQGLFGRDRLKAHYKGAH